MKYGILTHIGFAKKEGKQNRIISIGDVLECLVIRNIYYSMGINEEDLITCYPYELNEYQGEYCLLPINVYALNIDYSYRILPVFLGLTLGGGYRLSQKNINLLRRFSPVGCRDERTMRRLIDNGIDAYMQGCLVATFPKRPILDSQKKVFFVNPEKGIEKFIPNELLLNCEFVSHDYYTTDEKLYQDGGLYHLGEKFIEKYSTEAKLVITSKYHSAILCLALGIPVIVVIENNYYKYSWLEKYIPIYEPKDYPNINWNPQAVCIPDAEKELMLQIARKRIQDTYEKYVDIYKLSEMRERPDIEYFDDIFYGNYAIEYVKKNWSKDIKVEYAFWGATDTSRKLNDFIADDYPGAHLKKVFDWSVRVEVEYKDGVFIPESLDNISSEENKNLFIFVTGNSASEAAKDLFTKLQRKSDTYFLCQRQVLTEEDITG